MAILIFNPSTGTCGTKTTLELARTALDVAGKTVVVTTALTEAQSNITGGWPSDRALRVEKGGSIANSTAFTINGPFSAGNYQVFVGSGAVIFGLNATQFVQPEWWGGIPNGAVSTTAMFAAVSKAWDSAITSGINIKHSAGVYDAGVNNFPYKNTANNIGLLDCKNITVYGVGPATVLKTTSVDGADVLNLCALENFHVRDLAITSVVTGSAAGSNGISVVWGFNNVTILDVYCYDLATVDSGYPNGGKALTLQSGITTNPIGSLTARIRAKGCAQGFGFETELYQDQSKNTSISVDIIAIDCYYGVTLSAAAATGALSTSMTSGVRVQGQAIDCQHGVLISRIHGAWVDVQLISTKTAAAKQLRPSGTAWISTDTLVDGLTIAYAKNAIVSVHGNAGACDHKARIGGGAAGSSGLNGSTEFCDINIDLGGTAAISDLLSLDSGGNTIKNSRLSISAITATAFPDAWDTATSNNRMFIGSNYTGSFTATLTGCTAVVTGTVDYSVNGNIITLNIPGITGTSNTNVATITGLPANLLPAATRGAIGVTVDNGTGIISRINITNTGVIDLYNGLSSGIFTTSGTKGIQALQFTYKR